MPRDSEDDLDVYWDPIRKRSSDQSFPAVAAWITDMHKRIGRSRLEKRKRRRRFRWFAIAILAVLFILSSTIRINRVERSGDLVTFSIDKKEERSFQKLSSLQQVFSFTCNRFLQPDQPSLAFFIFFMSNKEKLPFIIKQIRVLSGLQNLDISSVNYTIRESLLSLFWHKTLQLGEPPKPARADITRVIQARLRDKGLAFLSIRINDKDGSIAFAAGPPHHPDSVTITNKPDEKQNVQQVKTYDIPAGSDKLQPFTWLSGSWKVQYVPRETYHYWLRINDSLLMCFIIKYAEEGVISYGDGGPDISVGFSIRYAKPDSVILSLRGIEWKFLLANDREIDFKNETTPKSAHVKWSLGDEKKSWQSVISGERNVEIVTLLRDENTRIVDIVNGFIAKHPEVMKKN